MDTEPVLYRDLAPVWEAFHALSDSRQITMGGVGGIPFGAIDAYAERYGIEDFETFHRLIRAMDGAYVERLNKRMASSG